MHKANPEATRILADGSLRTVRIVGVHFENEWLAVSNMRGNSRACYARFALDVDGARVGIRQTVWIADVWLSPGASICVRAATEDPTKVVIDWAATAAACLDALCPFGGGEGLDWAVIPVPAEGRTDARSAQRSSRPLVLGLLLLLLGGAMAAAGFRLQRPALMGGGGLLAFIGLVVMIARSGGDRTKAVERIRSSTPSSPAKVLSLVRRGGTAEGGPVMKLTLEAPISGGEVRQFSLKRGVPADFVRHVSAGTSLPIHLVANGPNQSVIDWPGFARDLLARRQR